ncbi:MAG: hypothetical protein KKE24_03395 [Candidatus Thermoplasmatota archaeon]|nr:hypothetical protein [Candidatus Thermoplasmatota archaeon]
MPWEERKATISEIPTRLEDWILMLLFAGGRRQRYNEPIAGKTRLMKELFLFLMRFKDVKGFYSFRPYKYGPYSDGAWNDFSDLIRKGLIQITSGFGSEVYSLTPEGFERARMAYDSLEPRLRQGLVDIKIQYNMMPIHDLITHVYEHYPSFAKESEYEGPPVE